jgi:hypothetical protein
MNDTVKVNTTVKRTTKAELLEQNNKLLDRLSDASRRQGSLFKEINDKTTALESLIKEIDNKNNTIIALAAVIAILIGVAIFEVLLYSKYYL